MYCSRWLHLIDFKSYVKFWKSESGLPMQNWSKNFVSELIRDVCTGIFTYTCHAVFIIPKKVIKQYPCLADQNNYRKHCWIGKKYWSFIELELFNILFLGFVQDCKYVEMAVCWRRIDYSYQ